MARHSINSKRINAKAHGGKVKMAAEGNADDTGTPVTPAPVKKYVAPDMISTPRKPVNAPTRTPVSSIPPGFSALTPMGEVLKQDGDKNGTLDKIIQGAEQPDDQLRTVSDQSYPVAGGGAMQRQQNPDAVFGKKPS